MKKGKSSLIKLSFKSLLKERKKIFHSLIILVCSALLLSVLFFSGIIDNAIYAVKNYDHTLKIMTINPRSNDYVKKEDILASVDKDIEDIKKIKHVKDAFYSNEFLGGFATEESEKGFVYVRRKSENNLPKVTEGRKYKDTESGVAICPKIFYKSYGEDYINSKTKIETDPLGKTFTIIYKDKDDKKYTKTFEIVGLYNNYESPVEINTCFISPTDAKEIGNIEDPYSISEEALTVGSYPLIIAEVDNYKNIKEVSDEIVNLGMLKPDLYGSIPYDLISLYKALKITISILIIAVVIFVSMIYSKKRIMLEKEDIMALEKDYSRSQIALVYTIKAFINNLVIYLLGALIFFIIVNHLLNTYDIIYTYKLIMEESIFSNRTLVLSIMTIIVFPTYLFTYYTSTYLKFKTID